MRIVLVSTLLLAAPALAGCLAADNGAVAPAGVALPAADTLAIDPARPTESPAARWSSDATAGAGRNPRANEGLLKCLMDDCPDPPTPCTPKNCERKAIRVDVPDGWWETHDGFLDFSVRWPTVFADWFQIRIEDASGAAVAVGHAGYMNPFALVARLDRPVPGAYSAVLVHVSGKSPYEGSVQLESRPKAGEVRDLLPNLVTLPPTDLTFDDPAAEGPGYFTFLPGGAVEPAHRAAGARGCATEEILVESARRCLRFSNAVANMGEGPLEIRLPLDQGATAAAGGHFTQRVHRSDGTTADRPGGPAEFHPMHAHWHNAAANRYTVYRHDAATETRGEQVNAGHKAGVCFADIGLADLALAHSAPGRFSGIPCLNPAFSNDWVMGLTPNWYDNYYWPLVDQYVDLAGAPDGMYELCSVTNQDHTLLESDYSDNEACTVFRLAGDKVEVLSAEPYHHTPPGAN